MGKIELLEAELAMERAAADFREAKAGDSDSDYRSAKAALNAARSRYRDLRSAPAAGNGSAAVAPKAIAGKAKK